MVSESSIIPLVRAAHPRNHIVDLLIAERAPRLAASAVWPLARPAIYALLDYRRARAMADAIAPLSGVAALQHISDLLSLRVTARGLDRVPRSGRLVIVCNHPTGIADALAVHDLLLPIRRDMMFYANSDAHRIAPRFDEVLIPVEWREDKRTRERTRMTLTMTRRAMEAECALMIFPAGRMARASPDGHLADPRWAPSALSVARKYEAPILPMHLSGPWSTLFQLFNRFSRELRDMTIFHELLNKRGKAFRLIVGRPVAADALPLDPTEAADAMQAYVEKGLPADPEGTFA